MKKILLFILASTWYLSTFSIGEAISYNGSSTESPPFYTYTTGSVSISSLTVGETTSGSFSQIWGSSPSYYSYLPNFPLYYYSSSSYNTAVYDTNILLDFSGSTLSGETLLSKLYFYDTNLLTYFTLTGKRTVKYYVVNVADSSSFTGTLKYSHTFTLGDDIDKLSGGADPKKTAITFIETYQSDNGVLDVTYLQAIDLIVHGTNSVKYSLDFNTGGTVDYPLSTIFSGLSGCGMMAGQKSVNGINCHFNDGPYTFFPNAKYYKFNDLTSYIDASGAKFHSIGISTFYTGTGYINYVYSGTGGSSSGSIFEDCETLDIACWIGNGIQYIADTPERLWTKYGFSISWDADFNSCNTGSLSSSGITTVQKFANLVSIINPFPPDENDIVCTFWGEKEMKYQFLIPEQNFFSMYGGPTMPSYLTGDGRVIAGQTVIDIIVIFAFSILIFYKKEND